MKIKKIKLNDVGVFDLWGHSMNLLKGKLYVIGGLGRNSYTNRVYEVNPENWKITCIDMIDQNGPDLLAFHKVINYGNKLIIYGGQNEYTVSNKYYTFNSITRRWT